MAVPEAGSDNQTFAVDYRRIARDFDGSAWADCNNLAIVHKDRAVLDRLFSGRRINFCPNQGEIRSATQLAPKEDAKQEEGAK